MSIQNEINVDRRKLFKGAAVTATAAAVAAMVSAPAAAKSKQSASKLDNDFMKYKANQLEVVEQELVQPPFLPKHDQIAKGKPKVVKVRLVIEEKLIELEPGVKTWAMTFNGSVPGPMIVVHQYDYLELTLVNPKSSSMMHNIDLHSSTGALGAAGLTHVNPGEEATVRFRCTKAGVFVYHCAPGDVMIPWHVVSGMNGAMMVLPREGLTDEVGKPAAYDKAYYIGEQDFYLPKDKNGQYKKYDSPIAGFADTVEVMKSLVPTHIVFNGAKGAITGKNAMTADVGETVLFIHSQANRDTRPHLIGGHGDLVWERGSFADKPQTNLETWFVAGGSAAAAMYTFRQPGIYAYVNHNLTEAIVLGAAAHVKVEGEWDNDLMEQISGPHKI
ncbi:MAG: nitrite reductase, copper-containing [Gammaproteobacteria bacterium]|nr:nitrite reductase, copper-containing [Gammaproteobacteria bacterium]